MSEHKDELKKERENNNDQVEQPPEADRKKETYSENFLALGLCLGIAFGLMVDQLAVGISLGLCFGIALGTFFKKK
ncbi:hypothetical protein [Acetobacterium woodii]|uniref:Glycine zipper-like domain-containing protein n=1 Tax=Acetobacterium woodii (strain ATCC 29683 / DSM 1030 / JCM 2381 / KCTC 1655 / WB1) TaxID=931626 RepID=H6LK85_ACEWD|nr:hypothetical protein [Acetobacterium woodii]AFA50005.1 hypothetical protein Awo_c32770 [Acetobacterium woodii DSM 1030]